MTTVQLPADRFDATMTFVRPATLPTRVPLDNLAVLPGFNTRVKDDEYAARVADITQSIVQHGFYDDKPFSVVMLPDDPKVYIFDGEHRFDAARAALLDGAEFPDGLPVAFAKENATVRDLTVHLVHGNAGERLNQVELAAVVRRLKSLGLSKDEIAKEIQRTTRHVDNLLLLSGANQAVKQAVAGGKIAAAEAVKLLRKDPKEAAAKIADAVRVAEEKGKAKATPKTMQAVESTITKIIPIDVSFSSGGVVGDILKSLAKQLREHLKFGDDDKLTESATFAGRLSVRDYEAEAARAAKAKEREAIAAKRAEERAARDAERAKAAEAKAAEKKAKDAEKAAKKKAAEKAKSDATKAAAKAKADKAKAAAKVATAKGASAKKTPEQAKADAKAHLGTDKQPDTPAAKAAAGGKAAGKPEKPAKADPAPKAPAASATGESAASGSLVDRMKAVADGAKSKDPNKGL